MAEIESGNIIYEVLKDEDIDNYPFGYDTKMIEPAFPEEGEEYWVGSLMSDEEEAEDGRDA